MARPHATNKLSPQKKRRAFFRMIKQFGPGIITGASDDDPSGIGTYAVAGAVAGYTTLWVALYTLPLMSAVQYMCAKVGMIKGRGLAGLIRLHFPRYILYPAVFAIVIANTINAGVDIGAIASGITLLVPINAGYLIVPIALVIIALQVWGSYESIARVLKWLTLALLAYIGAAFFTHPNWRGVLFATIIPTMQWNSQYLSLIVAILGTTISPYMFFWQASQEVEQQIAMGRRRLAQRQGATSEEMRTMTYDVSSGMLFSNLVMFFIILATAATLHETGQTQVKTAVEAARALAPLAGRWSEALLAVGLIGAGLLAVPVLTGSAAYSIAETFKWRSGLEQKFRGAKQFYGVIIASTLVGMAINFLGLNPFDALVWSAIVNGVVAPPLIVLILLLTSNKDIMGEYANGLLVTILGWVAMLVMAAAAVAMFVTMGIG